jgi:hypothetical protein
MQIVNRMKAAGELMVLATALAGCGSGISYNHDMDPAANFTRFATYSWVQPPTSTDANGRGVSPLVDRRVVAAVDAQLAAKGYQLATAGAPDFMVNYVFTTSQQVDYSTYYTGMGYGGGWYGGGYGWGGGMSSAHTSAYVTTNGTFIVDVFDGHSKALIWRGTAKGTVDQNAAPEDRQARIQEAVAGTFQSFPNKTR